MRILVNLFLEFFKIGLFTFGGGYAMISVIENICVDKRKWITHDEMMNVTVMAESTPGPIAINLATYAGWRQAGLKGALSATFGMVLPSFLIILLLSEILDALLVYPVVQSAFRGIRLAVPLLILNAGFTMVRKMKKKLFPCLTALTCMIVMFLILLFSWNFSSVSVMLAAGCVSVCVFLALERRGKAK